MPVIITHAKTATHFIELLSFLKDRVHEFMQSGHELQAEAIQPLIFSTIKPLENTMPSKVSAVPNNSMQQLFYSLGTAAIIANQLGVAAAQAVSGSSRPEGRSIDNHYAPTLDESSVTQLEILGAELQLEKVSNNVIETPIPLPTPQALQENIKITKRLDPANLYDK